MSIVTQQLTNGLTVIADPLPHLETAALGVWVQAGARDEPAEMHGLSHLLEHMAFKGTGKRDARQIAEAIETVGGYLNAYTSHSETAYYARVLRPDVPLAIDLLGDILTNSTFAPEELAREREVIVQEIRHAEEAPDDIVFDHFQRAAYRGHPLGRSVLGTCESVRALTRERLMTYLGDRYIAPNMVLVASGAVDPDEVMREAERAFGSLNKAGAAADRSGPGFVGGPECHGHEGEQLHLVIGFNGVGFEDDGHLSQWVLSEILGGGMSSRLFQEIRERRGLAYSVYSFSRSYEKGGLLGIYAGLESARAGEVIDVVTGELDSLARNVKPDELARAKAQIKSAILRGRESPLGRMESWADEFLRLGRTVPGAELMARIDAIDAAAITALSRHLMSTRRPVLASVGPPGDLPSYTALARRFG